MGVEVKFSIPDYAVFIASLFASLGIGIYSSFTGRAQKTTDDFYFGNREMNVVAVALSLAATYLSAIGVLGIPSEVYHYGIGYMLLLVAEFICSCVAITLFVPFFYNLKLTSVYEYFEHRFNRTLRRCACLIFILNMLLYMALVLYAPALALSQVSTLPLWASIVATGMVCTIYTAIGGMKAVIWTDAFQMILMFVGGITVLVYGVLLNGGPSNIYTNSLETGRLELSLSPDPFVRQSVWSLLFGSLFMILPVGLNQATVQRYLSVKSKRAAQKVVALQCPTSIFWWTLLVLTGATMFTYYRGCDPLLAGRIERSDQTTILFVLDTLGHVHGLPGLFTAVIYSATMSTVSSGVNSIVMVLMEDFVKPLSGLVNGKNEVNLSKVLSFFIGFLTIGLANGASLFGSGLIIQFCQSIQGMCGGPLLGLFFCGMMLPFCNSKGASVGIVAGLIVTFWIGTGALLTAAPAMKMPLNIDNCSDVWSANVTRSIPSGLASVVSSLPRNSTYSSATETPASSAEVPNRIYRLSHQYYGFVGFTVNVLLTILVSLITGGQGGKRIPDRFFLYKVYSKQIRLLTEINFEDLRGPPVKNHKEITQGSENEVLFGRKFME